RRRRLRRRRIAIDADAIAELAAEQLIARHAIGLADQIHQRDLDAADTARLAAVAAEALDRLEQVFDVAGVLPDEKMLEPQRRIGIGTVTHFAEPIDALVRVDPDDRV